MPVTYAAPARGPAVRVGVVPVRARWVGMGGVGMRWVGVALLLLAADRAHAQDPARAPAPVMREHHGSSMGSTLSIKVIGTDPATLDRALAAAVQELDRIEVLMTDWRPSPLTQLNEAAGQGPHSVPTELAAIIARSIELHRLTNGAFDVTFARAGQLWNYKRPDFRFPSPEEIQAALPFIDASRVQVDAQAATVDLPAGMRIGLGGIAQGYGADRAMEILRSHGIEHALVDVSGDLKILGHKFGEPWEVAVKHPRRPGRALAVLRLSNTCLTTSGDYERFFEKDGQRYHHIIDPRTAFPSRGCISATVIAPNCEFADALATALCVLGPEKGLPLVESLPRVEAILVGMDDSVHVSTGLIGQVDSTDESTAPTPGPRQP
ncbi:MAG: FAD:protein FMN transferase [Planctomycetota bacterium]